jgi:D-sedoheptulose 7-phosphate isomerase
MSHSAIISEHLAQHQAAAQAMSALAPAIAEVSGLFLRCFSAGGTVFTCGNGGSAADAQHLSGELIGHYRRDRRPLPAVTLTADATVWTCIANDFQADEVFSRQVEALAGPGDIVVGFSTSGRSSNVVAALAAAKAKGASTVLFGGSVSGPAGQYADYMLLAPASTTPRIQELHTLMLHAVSDVVDAWAAGESE